MKLTYHVNPMKVRALCIKQQWYTLGANRAYSYMLNVLCKKRTLAGIHKIAVDIYEHSNKDRLNDYFADCGKEVEKCIAEYIINECTYIVIE